MIDMKRKTIKIGAVCLTGVLAAGVLTTRVYAKAGDSTNDTKQEITEKVNKDDVKIQVQNAVDKAWQPVDKSSKNYKDETVYVITDAEGNMKRVIVSEWLNNAQKLPSLDDKSSLTDIKDVKGEDNFTRSENGTLVWNTQGEDVYYQGNSDKELPVTLKMTYELDGSKITSEDLAGKSGHLLIRYDFTDNKYEIRDIAGKQEKIYVPFVAVTAMVLDNSQFDNIKVSSGKVINDGSKSVVAGMAFPGMSADLNLEDINLPEYVEVEADVTDFSIDGSYTVLTNSIFNNVNLDDVEDVDGLKDALSKLTDAMSELLNGSSKLYDGLAKLYNKTGDLKDGVNKLAAGAADLSSGATSLNTGAQNLQSGVATLASGLGTISSKSSALNSGAEQVFNTLLATATAQLTANGVPIPTMTISNYGSVLNNVIATQNQTIYDAVVAGVRANVLQGVLTAQSLTMDIYNTLPNENKAAIDAAVDTQMASPTVQQQINTLLQTYSQDPAYQSLLALKTQLDNYNEFYQGVLTYTAGVGSAYNGAGQISSGTAQLAQGASTLAAGADTLKNGMNTLASSTDTLIAGIAKLKDGAMQLRDGMTTFDEEGIQKISDIFGENFDELIDRLQAVVNVSKEYNSYAGISEDMKGSVKFIYKSDEIK